MQRRLSSIIKQSLAFYVKKYTYNTNSQNDFD